GAKARKASKSVSLVLFALCTESNDARGVAGRQALARWKHGLGGLPSLCFATAGEVRGRLSPRGPQGNHGADPSGSGADPQAHANFRRALSIAVSRLFKGLRTPEQASGRLLPGLGPDHDVWRF